MKKILIPLFVLFAFSSFCQSNVDEDQLEHVEQIHDNSSRAFLIGRVMSLGFNDDLPIYSVRNPVSDKVKEADDIAYQEGVIIDNNMGSFKFQGSFLAYENEIAMRTESADLQLLKKDKISGVMIGDEKFFTVAARQATKKGATYDWYFMKPLHIGAYALYALPKMKVKKVNAHPTLGNMMAEEEIVIEDVYYFAKDGEKLVFKIPANKSKFAQIFEKDADRMAKYMKETGLKPTNENDLVLLFMHYDDILASRGTKL